MKVYPIRYAPSEGITEFLDTLEPKVPGAAKRNPNDFIDESVLEEVLKGR
jgi:hypothetical protein